MNIDHLKPLAGTKMHAPPRRQFFRIAGLLACAVVAGLLFLGAYRERELWRVTQGEGTATAVVGQQRWFGLTGVHLVRRHQQPGGPLHAKVVAHVSTWEEAQQRANALHREQFGRDSQPHYESLLTPLIAGIAQGAELTAYEGLPHHHWEKELLARELALGKSIELDDFPFYKEPIPIAAEDEPPLKALGSSAASFAPRLAEKSCGGYHPDWCLEWQSSAGAYRLQLCFGCGEARIFGPKHELYCDLDSAAQEQLTAILKPY